MNDSFFVPEIISPRSRSAISWIPSHVSEGAWVGYADGCVYTMTRTTMDGHGFHRVYTDAHGAHRNTVLWMLRAAEPAAHVPGIDFLANVRITAPEGESEFQQLANMAQKYHEHRRISYETIEPPPQGFVWSCTLCDVRASLEDNAIHHMLTRGHGYPHLMPFIPANPLPADVTSQPGGQP